jgi:hypothetical protein
VPLRPLGLGELLDGAVGVVRRYPRPTLGMSAGIAVLTAVVNLPFLLSLADGPLFDTRRLDQGDTSGLDAQVGGALAGLGIGSLVSFLAGIVLAGVVTAVVGRAVLGQPFTLGEAWRQVRPLLLRLVGLALIVLLLIGGSVAVVTAVVIGAVALAGPVTLVVGVPLVVLALVAVVWLYVRVSLAPCALVLERTGIRTSLRRSGVLVRGSWWRVLGVLLLAQLITGFVAQVLQTPFAAHSFLSAFSSEAPSLSRLDIVLSSVGSALAMAVVSPFAAAVRALLYVDRRIRAEALDVSLTAAAGRATAGSPSA